MKSPIALSALSLLCLGCLLLPSARAQLRPHRGERSAALTSRTITKGKVVSFGYYLDPDVLVAIHSASCKFQLDTTPATTFWVNLDCTEPNRTITEGFCRLALDAFRTGQEIAVEDDSLMVQGVSVSR